jgi:hypothetical protein
MDSKRLFYITLVLSVFVQILTGGLGVVSLLQTVSSKFDLIKQILWLELGVQCIEGIFYGWLVFNIKHVLDITPKRYIDWSITTPTMLISLILYLIYSQREEKNEDTSELDFFELLRENSSTITIVLVLNWLMLLFGYLGEANILPKLSGIILGFIPFLVYQSIIYRNYVHSQSGFTSFLYFFVFWSLYGIVALLPYYLKNSAYNILDLFSKNFFGVFLSYIILFA